MTLDTRELNHEGMAKLFELRASEGWFLFSPKPFEKMPELPEITADTANKTPSQRLRASLFILWSQGGKKENFEMFYLTQMEKFIEAIKEKLI